MIAAILGLGLTALSHGAAAEIGADGLKKAASKTANRQAAPIRLAAKSSKQRKATGKKNKSPAKTYILGTGDQLNIVFYERAELSGPRTVDGQGNITLPLFGIINLSGKSTYELQEVLRTKYLELAGHETYVTVEIVERRPFYVLGLVKNPGAYPYVPNITVLQAMAVAGGLMRQLPSDPLFVNYHHERMRMTQAHDDMQKALAEHARLTAQLKGAAKASIPKRLIELVGATKAKQLIDLENDIMKLDKASYETRRASLVKTISHDEAELKAQSQRLAGLEKLLALQDKRLEGMRRLVKKNVVSAHGIVNTERETATTASDVRAIMADRATTKRLLEQHRRDLAMLKVDRNLQAKRDKLEAENQIQRAESVYSAAADFVSQVSALPMNDNPAINMTRLNYELVRDGKVTMVSSNHVLQPSDVLRVGMKSNPNDGYSAKSTGRMLPTSR